MAIGGIEDHIHILVGVRPHESLSKLVQLIKEKSSKWINLNQLTRTPFSWQSGFGAFAICKKDLRFVIRYILDQKKRHAKTDFQDEYLDMLTKEEVDFNEKYLFTTPK